MIDSNFSIILARIIFFCKPSISSTIVALYLLASLLQIQSVSSQQKKIDSLHNSLRQYVLKDDFTKKDTSYINTLVLLGKAYQNISSDSVLYITQRVQRLSTSINYTTGILKGYNLYGEHYIRLGNIEKAKEQYNLGLSLIGADTPEGREQRILMNVNYGFHYIVTGNYSKALSNFLKGADLALAEGKKKQLSRIYENIAIIYFMHKDFTQSIFFFKKAIALNKKAGDELAIAETELNISELYIDSKQFGKADSTLAKSISVLEEHKVKEWLAYGYQVKGRLELEMKKYNKALKWYRKSEKIYLNIDDPISEADVYSGMSKSFLAQKKFDSAFFYGKKGFKIASKFGTLKTQINISKTLYRIYKKKRDLANALEYFELHKKLSDSLAREENNQSLGILKAELKHDAEKKTIADLNNRAIAKQRYILYSVIGLLILMSIIAIITNRNQNTQKRLNFALKEKNTLIKEREQQLIESNNTKNRLFSIIGHDLKGPIGSLQSLLDLFTDNMIKKNDIKSVLPSLKTSVDNTLFTINNLLSWGNSQMQSASIFPETKPILKLIDNSMGLLSEMAAKKSITIHNKVAKDAKIYADENHVDVIVRNLLSNAVKFTPENGTIQITTEDLGDAWKILIKDSGVGISEEVQKLLFLDQANTSTYGTNDEKGTGLGLLLSKEMVEKNNGIIGVESEEGVGSTFYFTLPK